MDSFDRQIVQFIVRWAPFGGPPAEDTLPGFGLTPAQLRQRFANIISAMTLPGVSLSDDDAALLVAARRAIALSQRRVTPTSQRFHREPESAALSTCGTAPRSANSMG